jgi:hypothetical protein
MKHIHLTTTFVISALFSISIAQAQTVLSGGESWSAYDVLDFEDKVAGRGLAGTNPMTNSGSNGGTWNTNSQAGKFVTNNQRFRRYRWRCRELGHAPSITPPRSTPESGGSNLTFRPTIFSGFNNLDTGGDLATESSSDFYLRLKDGGTKVADVTLRIWDVPGAGNRDGLADEVQGRHTSTGTGGGFSQRSTSVDSSSPVSGQAVWTSLAIEFDLATKNMYYIRNGSVVQSVTLAQSQFDSLELGATGFWDMTPADTGVLETDLIGLYTAIPEPSSAALILLAGGALWFLRRKRS